MPLAVWLGGAESKLTLDSSDARLVEAFTWAKRQALAHAFEGDPVGSWYEAALPGREAFCMRDVSHQAMGAHALGLAPHTSNMLRQFSENISESKDWCSYWEINRYRRPAPVDYQSDAQFWYCLPANYDVLDACYRMYLWTGDLAYIDDPVFLNFYSRTVSDFEQRWSLDLPRIMKRKRWMNGKGEFDPQKPFQFFRGNPSYQQSRADFVLGVELLATQYAAYLAYAGILDARRNDEAARAYLEKAAAVKALVNHSWWDEKTRQFYARLNKNYQLEGHDAAPLLYRNIVDSGPKLKSTLDALLDSIAKNPSRAVEEQSHHAEILYRYGVPGVAFAQMMDLAREGRERREYPEVSYSVVGAMVTGLMGINLDATPCVRTLPGLGSIACAELRNLPVRRNEVAVRHEGNHKTLFTNERGPTVIWRASFAGSSENLLLNGKPIKARVEKGVLHGEVSFVDVPVAPGATAWVEIPK